MSAGVAERWLMSGRALHLALLALALTMLAPRARAHVERTAYLEIVESQPGQATAVWKLPAAGAGAHPVFPPTCAARERETEAARPQSVRTYVLTCPGSLHGLAIAIDAAPGARVDTVVVRVLFADGTPGSSVLRLGIAAHEVVLPGASDSRVSATYLRLGVVHILSGVDHTLFVLALFLLASTRRALLLSVTAFTVAHSLTLALAATGVLRVSSLAAEACVALSLVLVALDVGRGAPRAGSPALAFGFGLVHGLGFAGALAESGLPAGAVPLALLTFNVGVEVGQLAFVAALAALTSAIRALRGRRASVLVAYATGTVGSYLFLDRLQEILRAR